MKTNTCLLAAILAVVVGYVIHDYRAQSRPIAFQVVQESAEWTVAYVLMGDGTVRKQLPVKGR